MSLDAHVFTDAATSATVTVTWAGIETTLAGAMTSILRFGIFDAGTGKHYLPEAILWVMVTP